LAKHHITQVCQPPYSPDLAPWDLWLYPKAKIPVEREEIGKCDGHTVHTLNQRRLTADWLAPRESDCSRMYSKVSSDWLPSYIKAMRPVLEIFKMAGYFTDRPRLKTFQRERWHNEVLELTYSIIQHDGLNFVRPLIFNWVHIFESPCIMNASTTYLLKHRLHVSTKH